MQTDFSRNNPSLEDQISDLRRPSLPDMMGNSKFSEVLTPMLTFDQNSNLKVKP